MAAARRAAAICADRLPGRVIRTFAWKLTAKLFVTAGAVFLLVTAGLWGQSRFAQGQLQLALAAELEPQDRSPLYALQLPNPEQVSTSPQPSATGATGASGAPGATGTTGAPGATGATVAAVNPMTETGPQSVELKQGQPMYRLLIPGINVNNIVVYGSSTGALKKGPGHIEGTPFPWQGGNSAVAAHRDYFFWRLGELEIGDEVRVESDLANRVYKVTDKRVVNESNVGVLSPTGKDQMTLITCWPLIFPGDTPDRLVITAELQ